MAPGFPPTLSEFLDHSLPQFRAPPDPDWGEGVAEIYKLTVEDVDQAIRRWFSDRRSEPERPRGYDAVLHALRSRGAHLQPRRDSHGRPSVRAACPAHDDKNPSLVVTREHDGRALVRCFAGCRLGAVVDALGLKVADLFPTNAGTGSVGHQRREVVATYPYHAFDGRVIAVKERFRPKGFAWATYDAAVSVYHLLDIVDWHRVVLVEGEKSADALWELGVAASCPPHGASSWREAWSHDIWAAGCRELIVLADNDRSGRDHAERVAAITTALDLETPIAVKVLDLPDQPAGGDVVDWLAAGHSAEELETLAAATPAWSPELRAEQQAAHRQALRRARNLRYRAKVRAGRETPVCQADADTGETPVCSGPGETPRMSGREAETLRMSSGRPSETVRRETVPNVPQRGTSQHSREVQDSPALPTYVRLTPTPQLSNPGDSPDSAERR